MFWSQLRAITLMPVFIIATVFFYTYGEKVYWACGEEGKIKPLKITAIILLVLELMKQVLSLIRGYDLYHIPLHFCSLFIYFLPLAAFYKGKFKDHVRIIAGVVGTCLFLFMAVYPLLIYPDGDILRIGDLFKGDIYAFFPFHSVVFHNIALFVFFSYVCCGIRDFKTKRDLISIIIVFSIYAVVAGSIANLLDVNFNNFRSCNAPFLESVRLDLVANLGFIGQLIYVLIMGVGTLVIPIIAYFVLRFFHRLHLSLKVSMITMISLSSIIVLGIILICLGNSLGIIICSIFTAISLCVSIIHLLHALKIKLLGYALIAVLPLLISITSTILLMKMA